MSARSPLPPTQWMGILVLLCVATLPGGLAGQQPVPSLDSLAARFAAIPAVSGYEQSLVDTLLALLPGSARDRAGDVVLTLGEGEPRTLIACPLDEPGFLVGAIRADGYLTLRRAGAAGPLGDQQLEGQRVTITGRKGPVPGVVGVRSIHLTRGRTITESPFTVDEAFVDVGASTGAEAAGLGIELLSVVTRARAPLRYGDSLLATPVAGRRAACAALLRAGRQAHPARGRVVIAFLVEQNLTRRGLSTIARTLGPFTDAILLDAQRDSTAPGRLASLDPANLPMLDLWGLPVRYGGTQVETVSLTAAARMERALVIRIGGGE
ncbi:MAG: hypothetical protein ABI587_05655 [Gemmatimonadales bacterium]